jgi:dTDP-4-dehydrorhamnose reductase
VEQSEVVREKMTKTVLVLGADGMLGHRIVMALAETQNVKTIAAIRSPDTYASSPLMSDLMELNKISVFSDFEAENWQITKNMLLAYKPDYVINCVGIIKQRKEDASNAKKMIEVNALFPHKVAEIVNGYGGTTISFSSDCVFLGDKIGAYNTQFPPDARSLYGRTKYLGEVGEEYNALTLRTSFIGFEIKGYVSLLEWFVGCMEGRGGKAVYGFKNAIWSGVTTRYMAGFISFFIQEERKERGVYHFGTPDPINKFELLKLLNETLGLGATIAEDDRLELDKVCNRHLNSNRFYKDFGYKVRSLQEMMPGLEEDYAIYKAAYPERY